MTLSKRVVRLYGMKNVPHPTRDPETHVRFAVLAADVALFTILDGELCVRLMTVNRPPHFVGQPGLPGGLIRPDETADETAKRLIEEKGLVEPKKVHVEQLYTFSRIDRDPRGRVVAVGYLGLVAAADLSTEEKVKTSEHYWLPVSEAKRLAYDHDEMLLTALSRLRSRVHYTTLISKLMPKAFTLTELETVYEQIIGTNLDKRNFRKKILKLGILEETGTKRTDGAFRPAALYRFTATKVREIEIL